MKNITIYRDTEWMAKGIVWQSWEPTLDEVDPKGAVYITYTIMPNEFCDFVQNATKDKVHNLLDNYIMK